MTLALVGSVAFSLLSTARAGEKTETFDKDPGWDGYRNVATDVPLRKVKQDFGYKSSNPLSREGGAIGGLITPTGEKAWYLLSVPELTFDQPFSASGRFLYDSGKGHLLVGFFHSETIEKWRSPNTVALRFLGKGEATMAFVEYCTQHWRAGGDHPGGFFIEEDPETKGRKRLRGFKRGAIHTWSLEYDPKGNEGAGTVKVVVDNEQATCVIDPEHRADGARFNRFGIMPVCKSHDDAGTFYMDSLVIQGQKVDLSRDPQWLSHGNIRQFETADIRAKNDFCWRPTHTAGGSQAGELQGKLYRGDCRDPKKLGALGDRLGAVSLKKPLRMKGRLSVKDAVSDSSLLIGFYHSRNSLAASQSQSTTIPERFLGVAIEGPSREGFFLAPTWHLDDHQPQMLANTKAPRIEPDGRPRDFEMRYTPADDGSTATIVVTLDGKSHSFTLPINDAARATPFDRFGVVTTWIDGNGQELALDDLTYTVSQE